MSWNTLEELRRQIKLKHKTPYDLYLDIADKLDYSIEFAEDRVKQVSSNWNESLYADCVSSQGFIKKQIKSTKDELSEEEHTLTSHLEKIANYILYSSFDNLEEKNEWERLKEKKKELKRAKKVPVSQREDQIKKIDDKQNTRLSLLSNNRRTESAYSFTSIEQLKKEDRNFEIGNDTQPRVFYTRVDKELNQKKAFNNNKKYWEYYWDGSKNSNFSSMFSRIDSSVSYRDFSYDSLKQVEEGIKKNEELLSKGVSQEKKKKIEKMIRENRGDYNLVSDILRSPVILKVSMVSKAPDPWLLFHDKVDYSKEKIIKEILYNYQELKRKYSNVTDSILWCVLQDIEKLVEDSDLTERQRLIANLIMKESEWTYQDIQDEVEFYFYRRIAKSTVTSHLEEIVRKIVKEHEKREEKVCTKM